jgi:hypothetical protein
MGRVVLIVVLAGVVILGGALLLVGAFPPNPPQQPVSHVLDNERFKTN